MAERKGSAFRRVLTSAERLSEAAIFFGSFSVNTPCSRSSASERSVTSCDQRLVEGFAFDVLLLAMGCDQMRFWHHLNAKRRLVDAQNGIGAPNGEAHALSRGTVALVNRPLDA